MDSEQYKWYILHVLSGNERKTIQAIKDQAAKNNISDSFEEIVVPVEQTIEIRRGRKINTERKVFPGYILLKMHMNDITWHIVRKISKVTGFLGNNGKPRPVSESEIKRIFKQIEESSDLSRHSIVFEIGESVKIIDGPFESFIGTVEEIDNEKARLKVSVSIFGRATPVELEYTQVTKIQ